LGTVEGAAVRQPGGYYVVDQVEFDGVVGVVKFDVVFEQLIELLLRFGGEDQRLDGEAVTQGVHRGPFETFRGFRPGCESSVPARLLTYST
jgi:hypothetical protein